MVLDEIDEELRRLRAAFHPAGFAGLQRNLALVDKAFRQRPGELFLRLKGKVLVVGVRLPGGKHVGSVVKIIVPFAGKQRRVALFIARMQKNHVAAVFRGQVNVPVRDRLADLRGNLLQNVRPGAVFNLVDGIKAQAVQTVLRQPVERCVGDVLPHRLALVGDAAAPRRHSMLIKKRGRQQRQIVPLRAEVVEHDIQHHGKPQPVRGVDKRVEILRRAVRRVRGIQQHPVVPPAAGTAKLGDGHDFKLGNPQLRQIRQLVDRRPEGALRGKRADVQFVNDRLFPRPPCPVAVDRLVTSGIDHD